MNLVSANLLIIFCTAVGSLAAAETLAPYTIRPTLTTLRAPDGHATATIFSTGYFLPTGPNKRAVVFAFNGGPGSSSVWWHLGGIGPRRVNLISSYEPRLRDPAELLTDNPHTWLTDADLVFVDPVLTGYSRPAPGHAAEEFFGYDADCAYLADFIAAYLQGQHLESAPLILAGSSYGTLRVLGIAEQLAQRHHRDVAGLILSAAVLHQQHVRARPGNDLPIALALPTYVALARWRVGERDIAPASLAAIESAALVRYLPLLQRLDVPAEETALAAQWLASLTGIPSAKLVETQLRLSPALLAERGTAVGRVDGRFSGPAQLEVRDPALATIIPLFAQARAHLFATATDFVPPAGLDYLTYNAAQVRPWSFAGVAENEYFDGTAVLKRLLTNQPTLRVLIGNGLFDLDGCYFASTYGLARAGFTEEQRQRLTHHVYPSGHMLYLDPVAAPQFAADVRALIRSLSEP